MVLTQRPPYGPFAGVVGGGTASRSGALSKACLALRRPELGRAGTRARGGVRAGTLARPRWLQPFDSKIRWNFLPQSSLFQMATVSVSVGAIRPWLPFRVWGCCPDYGQTPWRPLPPPPEDPRTLNPHSQREGLEKAPLGASAALRRQQLGLRFHVCGAELRENQALES